MLTSSLCWRLLAKRFSINNGLRASRNFASIREDLVSLETASGELDSTELLPRQVVAELDKHIVGQADAKRAVAVALRDRWRRSQLPPSLQDEVRPKNILMIGPTGVGKTEIARRLAKLQRAPFIKVEATKFTEVGFHGKDVDTIIRDLLETAVSSQRDQLRRQRAAQVRAAVDQRLLELLFPRSAGPASSSDAAASSSSSSSSSSAPAAEHLSRLEQLQQGLMNHYKVEIDVPDGRGRAGGLGGAHQQAAHGSGRGGPGGGGLLPPPPPTDANGDYLPHAFAPGGSGDSYYGGGASDSSGQPRTRRRKVTVEEARPILEQLEFDTLFNTVNIAKRALDAVQQSGVVFIDEIDKICVSPGQHHSGADASSEGVQRDLLPLLEGTTVWTRLGNVDTSKILFIASGAFHNCKPSELLAELQGRLPIRVELKALDHSDLYRVLTEPEHNLIQQQIELLKTEGVALMFTDEAKHAIAQVAAEINEAVENIGARRLHTILERITDEVSFNCDQYRGKEYVVDAQHVHRSLHFLQMKTDLSKFIL